MTSFTLIRPTVWPQCTNVTDRTDGQTDRQTDNGVVAYSEPFYKRSPKNIDSGLDIWRLVIILYLERHISPY